MDSFLTKIGEVDTLLLEPLGLHLLEKIRLPAQHARVVGTDVEVVGLDEPLVGKSYLLMRWDGEGIWHHWF